MRTKAYQLTTEFMSENMSFNWYRMMSGQHEDPTATAGYLERNYCSQSVGTQTPHDSG